MTSEDFDSDPLALQQARRIDQVCRRFERTWQETAQRPSLELYLESVTPPLRSQLFIELLSVEWEIRLECGETLDLSDYQRRFPMFLAEIETEWKEQQVEQGFPAHSVKPRALPEKLGDFRLLGELGRGGMSVVYEAVQESLGRRVALKVLKESLAADQGALKRFRQEAMAVADRKSTRLNSSHHAISRMPSSA